MQGAKQATPKCIVVATSIAQSVFHPYNELKLMISADVPRT